MTQPSNWQKSIEGEWHGYPSIFDVNGNHSGYNKVYRSSVFKDGQTMYYMNTKIQEGANELLPRLEVSDIFAFGVKDSDQVTCARWFIFCRMARRRCIHP